MRTLISVLVPVYNEQATIGRVLQSILDIDYVTLDCEIEIVVCDDGSTDGTATCLRQFQQAHPGTKVVSHERNCGKGAAIKTALQHATGDYILIQDADLEYEFGVYPEMVQAIRNGAQVVYASRFLRRRWPTGMRPANFLANKLLTAVSNALFGLEITDEATALKLFHTSLLRSLQLTSTGFEFCPEVTAKLGLAGTRIVEVPVDYKARNVGCGKKVRWTDAVLAAAVLARLRFHQFPALPASTGNTGGIQEAVAGSDTKGIA